MTDCGVACKELGSMTLLHLFLVKSISQFSPFQADLLCESLSEVAHEYLVFEEAVSVETEYMCVEEKVWQWRGGVGVIVIAAGYCIVSN